MIPICEWITSLLHINLGMFSEYKTIFFPMHVMLQEWICYFIYISLLNVCPEILILYLMCFIFINNDKLLTCIRISDHYI